MPESTIGPVWIDQLLSLTNFEQQRTLIDSKKLLDASGLSILLDHSERLTGRAPRQAQKLSALCADIADLIDAPKLAARALYLQAQTFLIQGRLDTSLEFIERAQSVYLSHGLELDALRTNVGRMNVLAEQSRFQESLTLGESVLAKITTFSQDHQFACQSSDELLQLTARIYVNLATTYERVGRYVESLDATNQAERLFTLLGDREWLANVSNNRGLIFAYLGRAREAIQAFERSTQLRAGDPPSLPHAHTLINLGEAHLLLGNYTQSLYSFESARSLFETLDTPVDRQINLLHLATAYRTLNLYPEALSAYIEAGNALKELNMYYESGLALWGAGSVHVALERFAESESALKEAADLFALVNNRPMRSSVLLEQASLYSVKGQKSLALDRAQEALALLSDTHPDCDHWPVQQAYAHMLLADLYLPQFEQTEAHLLAASKKIKGLSLPHVHVRFNQRLGHLRLRERRYAEAIPPLDSAIQEIEQLRATLSHETLRSTFLHDKVAAYEDLVELYLAESEHFDVEKAFQMAEQAKSRVLLDLVAGAIKPGGALVTSPQNELELENMRSDLSAVYTELLHIAVGTDSQESKSVAETTDRKVHLQERARTLEEQINQFELQTIAKHGARVDSGAHSSTHLLSLDNLQETLAPHITLISYYTIGSEIFAFVVDSHGIHVIRQLSSRDRIVSLLGKLSMQWGRFRMGSPFVQRHMDLLERTTQQILKDLHSELFAPIEVYMETYRTCDTPEVRQLVIIPHKDLNQVPFHALYTGSRFLVDDYAMSYAPSAALVALQSVRQSCVQHRALVVGVSAPEIPAVELEATSVAQYFSASELLVNEEASIDAFKAAVGHCDLIHLACHGQFRHDNPLFSALKLHDGWLTAADVAGLIIDGALVTLSACESGRGRVLGGDESLGLARAFLGAGANGIIVSQWLVQDDVTAKLMDNFYSDLVHHQNVTVALRNAQRFIKSDHSHPYYWAAFMALGNGCL